jgi:hypothetical protein
MLDAPQLISRKPVGSSAYTTEVIRLRAEREWVMIFLILLEAPTSSVGSISHRAAVRITPLLTDAPPWLG